jgi:epoxyqueuosine reductase
MIFVLAGISGEQMDYQHLAKEIKIWAQDLGFSAAGIADTDLTEAENRLVQWLAAGYHGEMAYMARHGLRRSRPDELVPGTLRVVSVRMDYWPRARDPFAVLADRSRAYVSRYALGRDYHKVMRRRLQSLADRIVESAGPCVYRAFSDSAPVLEKPIASNAGLGWIGKHTNLIDPDRGSWFFLGELYVGLPLPVDTPSSAHCGTCARCMQACPTGAIVAPFQLDARRCISYLTIELDGPIPPHYRPLIGNRIYGCDDCQLVCPFNDGAEAGAQEPFTPRHGLDGASLVSLFGWSEEQFLERTAGSPIRRIGYQRWLRNIAVALGNAPSGEAVIRALRERANHPSELVREHVLWALARHAATADTHTIGPGPRA